MGDLDIEKFVPNPLFERPCIDEYEPPFVPSDGVLNLQAACNKALTEQIAVRIAISFCNDFVRQLDLAIAAIEKALVTDFTSELDLHREELRTRRQRASVLRARLTDTDGFPDHKTVYHPAFYSALASISPASFVTNHLDTLASTPPPPHAPQTYLALICRFNIAMKVCVVTRDLSTPRCVIVGDVRGRIARVDLVERRICWGPVAVSDLTVTHITHVVPPIQPRGVVQEATSLLRHSAAGRALEATGTQLLRPGTSAGGEPSAPSQMPVPRPTSAKSPTRSRRPLSAGSAAASVRAASGGSEPSGGGRARGLSPQKLNASRRAVSPVGVATRRSSLGPRRTSMNPNRPGSARRREAVSVAPVPPPTRKRVIETETMSLALSPPRGVLIIATSDKLLRCFSFDTGGTIAVSAGRATVGAIALCPTAAGDVDCWAPPMTKSGNPQRKVDQGKKAPVVGSSSRAAATQRVAGQGVASSPPSDPLRDAKSVSARAAARQGRTFATERTPAAAAPTAVPVASCVDHDAEALADVHRSADLRALDAFGVPQLVRRPIGEDADGWVWARNSIALQHRVPTNFVESIHAIVGKGTHRGDVNDDVAEPDGIATEASLSPKLQSFATMSRSSSRGPPRPRQSADLASGSGAPLALVAVAGGLRPSSAARPSTVGSAGGMRRRRVDLASRLKGLPLAPLASEQPRSLAPWETELAAPCTALLRSGAQRYLLVGSFDGSVVIHDVLRGRSTGHLLPAPVAFKGATHLPSHRDKGATGGSGGRSHPEQTGDHTTSRHRRGDRDDRGIVIPPMFRADAFDLRPAVPGGAAGGAVTSMISICAPHPGAHFPARSLLADSNAISEVASSRPHPSTSAGEADGISHPRDGPVPLPFEDVYSPAETLSIIGRRDGAIVVAYSAPHCAPLRPPVPDSVQARLHERTRGFLGGDPALTPSPPPSTAVATRPASPGFSNGSTSIHRLHGPHGAAAVVLLTALPGGTAHLGGVSILVSCSSGGWVFSGGRDGVIRQWDAAVIAASLREGAATFDGGVAGPDGDAEPPAGTSGGGVRDTTHLTRGWTNTSTYGGASACGPPASAHGGSEGRREGCYDSSAIGGTGVHGALTGRGLGPAGTVLRTATGALIRSFANHHRDAVTGIAIHVPSMVMVTGSLDADVVVWSLNGSGTPLQVLRSHYHRVVSSLTLQAPAVCFADPADIAMHAGLLELARVGTAAASSASAVSAANVAASPPRVVVPGTDDEAAARSAAERREKALHALPRLAVDERSRQQRAHEILNGARPLDHTSTDGCVFDAANYSTDVRAWAVSALRARVGGVDTSAFARLPPRVQALLLDGRGVPKTPPLVAPSVPVPRGHGDGWRDVGSSVIALSLRPAVRGLPASDAAIVMTVGHRSSRVMRLLYGGNGAHPLRSARGVVAAAEAAALSACSNVHTDVPSCSAGRTATIETKSKPATTLPMRDSGGIASVEDVLRSGTADYAKEGGAFGRNRQVDNADPHVVSGRAGARPPPSRDVRIDAEVFPLPLAAMDGLIDPDGVAFLSCAMDGDICIYGLRIHDE